MLNINRAIREHDKHLVELQVKVSKRLTELYEELWLIERNLWACDNYIRDKDKEPAVAK